ncbi:MAG TPA: dynamin family protein, partial [Ideonella sp.]|nr:dynamin family protein [Ideonella sp.]
GAALQGLTHSLSDDRLVVAVVGEVGRGKSELANALFFADAGQRLLPVAPGGCTACPLELEWQPRLPATLDLLPIATRRQATRLAEWHDRRVQWQRLPLLPADPAAVAGALAEVASRRRVSRRQAASLGLLPAGPQADATQVDVPVWRHALANLPHPLLRQGLVVIDTPALSGVGIEPELTMDLLPAADALLFVLAAGAGVDAADKELWTQHLHGLGAHCLVVLNQLDLLPEPEPGADAGGDAAVAQACAQAAAALGVPAERVWPVSARQALAACWQGDEAALGASRIAALEAALRDELLKRRHRTLANEVGSGVLSLMEDAKRRMRDQRRGHAEQMLGLRGLRSESGDRFTQLKTRLQADSADLQQCTAQLDALRAVQAQAQRRVLRALDTTHVQAAAAELQAVLGGGLLRAGSRAAAFAALCQSLRGQIDDAAQRCAEVAETWRASFEQLNARFGSFLATVPAPDLLSSRAELELIERGYSRYFSVPHAVRMATPEAAEPLRRMLVAKLRLVFDDAREALASWHQTIAETIAEQLGERRQQLQRRQDTLERIDRAAGELEQHLHELEAQDNLLLEQMDHAQGLAATLRERAERGPLVGGDGAEEASPAAPPPATAGAP